jgi:hypothetical protein
MKSYSFFCHVAVRPCLNPGNAGWILMRFCLRHSIRSNALFTQSAWREHYAAVFRNPCHFLSGYPTGWSRFSPSALHINPLKYGTIKTDHRGLLGSRGSSGSIVSDYGLGDRSTIPDKVRGFSSSLCVQTGSGDHPASCAMSARGSFPGGKARPERDADHSPPSSAKFKYE